MDNTEIVEKGLRAMETGDLETLDALLGDGFRFEHEAMPAPLDREQMLEGFEALATAFPDWRYNAESLEETADGVVEGTTRITGTHTGPLDLSVVGGPVVPATGKAFELPAEPGRFEVEDDRIVANHVVAVEGGGLPGILAQLGIERPRA